MGARLLQYLQISELSLSKLKNKNHLLISIDAEKVFQKIQQTFITKTLQKVDIKGTYLSIIKAEYNRPRANITFH